MQKLNTIDLFRGLFAFILMIYHYLSWSSYYKNSILNFFSIYGVEAFFIISGVVLTYRYRNNDFNFFNYIKKRLLRILPLFYFLVLLDIVYKGIILNADMHYYLQTIFGDIFLLNMFRPDLTSVVSGWSVMDEMLFYLLFPFIILLRDKYVIVLTLITTVLIYVLFDKFVFDSIKPFVTQNIYYVSPIFNIPFFLIGITIGILKLKYINLSINKYYLASISVLIILYAVINTKDAYIEYILGVYRIYSILLISLLIFFATFTTLNENNIFYKIFKFFAKISYSLYLMHFVVFYVLYSLFGLHTLWMILLVSIGTSYLTYILIEKKFTNYLRAHVFK